MDEEERARVLQASGRHVEGLTELVGDPLRCDHCEARGGHVEPALVATGARAARVALCAEHFTAAGLRLGENGLRVLLPTGPATSLTVPAHTAACGYARVILDYRLCVVPPDRLTFVAARGGRHTGVVDGRTRTVLPKGYRPGDSLPEQLEFALKYDGVNLEVLAALFDRVDLEPFEQALAAYVLARPTGQYARRLWFLYEFLTGRTLPLPDAATGNYVPLLDPDEWYTAPPVRSRRHRVLDNLLGNADFCPMVRRSPRLAELSAANLAAEAARIVQDFDEDTIRRAVRFLYTKETRSSFGIEGESPSASRTERFVRLLKEVPALSRLTREDLVRLQVETVDPRFTAAGYRDGQVWVGEPRGPMRNKVHFVAARPDDVPRLMDGLLRCLARLDGSGVDAVVQAAAVSFGFVFVHPFWDGNGRLHRLLIHHVLARTGFTPEGLIFPVSAVMLQKRHEYDRCLEAFSDEVMQLVDFEMDEEGRMKVLNATSGLYRAINLTRQAEALYGWVRETVVEEFRAELEFVVGIRETRRLFRAIVDLPDNLANLFIKVCLQNGGRLSATKRQSHFAKLTDAEVGEMELAVHTQFERFSRVLEHEAEYGLEP